MEHLLRRIILSGNSLTEVPEEIRQFSQLSYVDLQHNQIRSIGSGAFKFPDRVEQPGELDLSYNQIANISSGAFQGTFCAVHTILYNLY